MSKSYFELTLNDREVLQDEKIYELNRLRQRSHCKTINESSAADMARCILVSQSGKLIPRSDLFAIVFVKLSKN